MPIRCPNCNETYHAAGAKVCHMCGSPLPDTGDVPEAFPAQQLLYLPLTKTFNVNDVSFQMNLVEPGSFWMGVPHGREMEADSFEKPSHLVKVGAFYIGEAPVTQALWKAVMDYNPSGLWDRGDNRPVTRVSWSDCDCFLRKLNDLTDGYFRLPTEAEWEYAARGGSFSKETDYPGSENVYEVAWFRKNSRYKVHDVKGKLPNELGLYDMAGNVYEWCQDIYDYYDTRYHSVKNKGWRVIRGGCFGTDADCFALDDLCRVWKRGCARPGDRGNGNGLRLCLGVAL